MYFMVVATKYNLEVFAVLGIQTECYREGIVRVKLTDEQLERLQMWNVECLPCEAPSAGQS